MLNPHPDQEAFLRAIRDVPEDDTRRLVFADWLSENGEEDRGAFIRVQCRIAALERYRADLLNDDTDWSRCSTESGIAASWCPNCGDCSCPDREERMDDPGCPLHAPDSKHCCQETTNRKLESLRKRERELFADHSDQWFGIIRRRVSHDNLTCEMRTSEGHVYTVRRGFINSVRCPIAAWMGVVCERCAGEGRIGQHWDPASDTMRGGTRCPACRIEQGRTPGIAAAVCSAHPVTAVRLTCREPYQAGARDGGWFWIHTDRGVMESQGSHTLPDELWRTDWISVNDADGHRKARTFDTPALAHAALSTVLVMWGKAEAVRLSRTPAKR